MVHEGALSSAGEELEAERRRAESQRDELKALAMDVASRSERIDELERVSNRLAEGIVERERELKRVRAELAAAGARSERMLESIQEAIKRLAGDRAPVEDVVPASSNGHAERTPAELFDGFLEVEVGPLGDFSQLVGFEDAARSIAATSEISITRFSEGGRRWR